MNEIAVRLFGAFRDQADGAEIRVTLPREATVETLREAFGQALTSDNARSLLRASAFATDDSILSESDPVPTDRDIAILPPVCGG
jgi:molybdopterin converting factor small subunit